MLTILHVPYTYYPDPVGGTEIYVQHLVHGLNAHGVQNIIVAPGQCETVYPSDGSTVRRLGVVNDIQDLNDMYGMGDEPAARTFGRWLDVEQPDVVHLHAFTRIVSVRFVDEAHARGIPVVFTYHTPTMSCLRGTLMLWGREACDGVLETNRCTRCRLQSFGVPQSLTSTVAHLPSLIRAQGSGHHGKLWTALALPELVARQHAAFRVLMARVDHVIALCEWTRQLLEQNQVPAQKIALIPHGLTFEAAQTASPPRTPPTDNLRLVALGRLEPIKGLDVLVRALAQLPAAPITLDVYGIQQDESETPYARRLRALVARDARVRLLPTVSNTEIIPLLQRYDILAVPSQWLETGPLVVLEAFAAGIPVIGSALGGIAEKVQHGVNGMLVSPLNQNAWCETLERLAQDRGLVQRLRAHVRPPRTIDAVVREHLTLYKHLAARQRVPNA